MTNREYNRRQIEVAYKGIRKDVTKTTYVLTDKIGRLLVRTIKRVLKEKGYDVRGELVNSIVYQITDKARGYSLDVFSTSEHAERVVSGFPAGTFPKVSTIAKWVSTRGGISFYDEFNNGIDGIAFLIARAISQRGIPPFAFMTKAYREAEPQIERYIEQLGKNYGVRI